MMPELTFLNRLSGVHSKTTVRPSRPLGIGRQSGIPLWQGLPDEELTSGWANVQSNNYWSATSNANNTNNAWIVNMWNGNVNNNNKTNNNYVWPVRSGEWLTFETLLVERLSAIYEPIFIYDSYACRKDKGLHKAVKRVKELIRKGSKNGRTKLYFTHMDIRNFFMTIDKEILYSLLEKKTENEDLLWLASVLIFHNPIENCIIKGNKHLIKHLPPHKSLFHATEDKGLPIGNLTSQFFANLYLNELDQYVKHVLKCKYYVRYCDDFLILDESPDKLGDIKERIRRFVADRLNLSLNEKYNRIFPVSNGIDFLGYIIRPDYMLVRRRVINNLKTRLELATKRLISPTLALPRKGEGVGGGMQVIRYDYELLEQLRSVLASYRGHMKWADTYSLRRAILKRYSFLKEYFSFDGGRITPLYKYCEIFPSVKSQYLYYMRLFRDSFIFFQVGCFYEFYGEIRDDVRNILGLRRLDQSKRGVRYGFPLKLEGEYIRKMRNTGIQVIIIRETDRYIGKIKERLPVMKIVEMGG